MYTIKEASARTGVGAPLIRAWERRYGVVEPTRTASGYRLYDDATLRVLVAMRSLVDAGWTASEAARAIKAGEVAIEGEPVERTLGGPDSPGGPDMARATHRARLIGRFVAAAESASAAETEAALDEMLVSGSFESVVDDLLLPAVAALGDAWAAGRMSVAAEHAASAAVARRLSAVFQAAGAPTGAAVVVGLPPGSRHELGAFAFAATLRRRGLGVLYVGADVTIGGWLDAVARTRARGAVIGVVTPDDRAAAADVVTALHAAGVPVIAVGGQAASPDPAPGHGVLVLPPRITEAAEVVARALGRRR